MHTEWIGLQLGRDIHNYLPQRLKCHIHQRHQFWNSCTWLISLNIMLVVLSQSHVYIIIFKYNCVAMDAKIRPNCWVKPQPRQHFKKHLRIIKSWMFLILFYMHIYIWHKVSVLTKQNNYFLSTTSFHQVIYHGFFRCEGKCSSQHQVGIVLENIALHNFNDLISLISIIKML